MVNMQLLVGTALVCAAALAASSQQVPAPGVGGPPVMAAPVSVLLAPDKKTYSAKDPIKLTLTVKNPGKTPVKITFNSGMKYDFEIRKGKVPSGDRVWQWARGHMFTQMVTFTSLDPGKTLTFTETYTPGDKGGDGKPIAELEPGTYTATGIFAMSGRAPRPMASAAFTVR